MKTNVTGSEEKSLSKMAVTKRCYNEAIYPYFGRKMSERTQPFGIQILLSAERSFCVGR